MAAEIGLAGASRSELRARMCEALHGTGISEIIVVGDADIALYGATEGEPGLIVIGGTGSICCGISGRGRRICAGGWGPVAGDEGGGSWIARRALRAIARAADGRGAATSLTSAACAYFHVSDSNDLSTAIYAPTITNERLAGFAKYVIEAAKTKDRIASEILAEAGKELGTMAAAVIRNLRLQRDVFQVAYVGGVFAAGEELVLSSMRQEIRAIAPRAFLDLAAGVAKNRLSVHRLLQQLVQHAELPAYRARGKALFREGVHPLLHVRPAERPEGSPAEGGEDVDGQGGLLPLPGTRPLPSPSPAKLLGPLLYSLLRGLGIGQRVERSLRIDVP